MARFSKETVCGAINWALALAGLAVVYFSISPMFQNSTMTALAPPREQPKISAPATPVQSPMPKLAAPPNISLTTSAVPTPTSAPKPSAVSTPAVAPKPSIQHATATASDVGQPTTMHPPYEMPAAGPSVYPEGF